MKNNLLPNSPSLNETLSQIHLGVQECIFYLTFHHFGDERISRFAKLYAEDATRDLESLCDEVGMSHSEFLGHVVAGLYENGISVSKLIVSLYLPVMVKKSIEHALSDAGELERAEWLRAAGIFVTPNSKVVNINTNQSII